MKKLEKLPPKKKILISLGAFLLTILIAVGISFLAWQSQADKINPGTMVGPIPVGKKSLKEARALIKEELQNWEQRGLMARHNNIKIAIPAAAQFNVEASLPIFVWQQEKIDQFLKENLSANSWGQYLISYFSPTHLNTFYELDEELFKKYLTDNLSELTITPQNASFMIREDLGGKWEFVILPERIGRQINFDSALKTFHKNLTNLDNKEIVLFTETVRPKIYISDLEGLSEKAEALVKRGSLTLIMPTEIENATSTWTIATSTIASWIVPQFTSDPPTIDLDFEKIKSYLEEKIAPEINQEPQTPRYQLEEKRLTGWSPSAIGKKLNTEASVKTIYENYLKNNISEAQLSVDILLPEIKSGENPLRIEEIVGVGQSNFVGSSKNRRHNIKIGADTLHGLLIAPGEEFSLIKSLGDMDASAGYLPEYVIKGDKTVLEYGGGLCQVATTIFRSALGTGLPITMRQNHSYRVSYYEPAGMDATIYDPLPDVRFINDTPDYILIQSRIEGDNLYFDFWGKSDGRQATTTTPVIFNIVKPAPTKIVETTDLKPGEKKCTENSHNGADAYFDYTVIYPNGEEKTERFKSHYVPWQAICLVGVDPEKETEEELEVETEEENNDSENKASSTPELTQ